MHMLKEELFNKEIKINILSNSVVNGNLNAAQLQILNLLLELQNNPPGSSKELLVQITSESDPLLLLTTVINETSYHALKSTQGLLVDFHSFPHHFTDLIKKCVEDQQNDSAKFVLILRNSSSEIGASADPGLGRISLEIAELNAFRHLCHLSLGLTAASLQSKLSHLSSCIKILKTNLASEREKAKFDFQNAVRENVSLQEGLTKKSQEIEFVKVELQQKLQLETDKHTCILKEGKEKHLKTISECDRKWAREKRELEKKYEEKVSELKSDNSSLKKKNSELNSQNKWLDGNLRETNFKVKNYEEKCNRHVRELNEMSNEREELRRKLRAAEDTVRDYESRHFHQTNEIQEKERNNQSLTNQIGVLSEEKVSLQQNFKSCRTKLQKKEEDFENLHKDFNKSLDVLKKFKSRMRLVEDENVSLNREFKDQNRLLNEREQQLNETKEEIEKIMKELPHKEKELEETKNKLRETEETLKEKESTIKSNENVISWLNKQLNEMETVGATLRKAPLVEAFIQPLSNRNKMTNSAPSFTPIVNTSTPINAQSAPSNLIGSARMHSLSSVHPLNDIPPIPEEINSQENDKENLKFNDPSRRGAPLKVHGILRANAIKETENYPKKDQKGLQPTKPLTKRPPYKPSDKAKDKKQSTVKQSAYFGKS